MPPDFCNTVSHIFMIPYSALVASRLLGVVRGFVYSLNRVICLISRFSRAAFTNSRSNKW